MVQAAEARAAALSSTAEDVLSLKQLTAGLFTIGEHASVAEAVRHLTEQRLGSVILVTVPSAPPTTPGAGPVDGDAAGTPASATTGSPPRSDSESNHGVVTGMLTARDLLRAIAASLPPLPPTAVAAAAAAGAAAATSKASRSSREHTAGIGAGKGPRTRTRTGAATTRALATALLQPALQFATPAARIVSVGPGTPVRECLRVMSRLKVRSLPVIDHDSESKPARSGGALHGVVTLKDLVDFIAETQSDIGPAVATGSGTGATDDEEPGRMEAAAAAQVPGSGVGIQGLVSERAEGVVASVGSLRGAAMARVLQSAEPAFTRPSQPARRLVGVQAGWAALPRP